MPDTVRERIAAALATRMGAGRGDRRPELPIRTLFLGPDTLGRLDYGVQQITMTATVEAIEAAPAATNDPVADALTREQAAHALLGDLIADMGSAAITDIGGSLADSPVYVSGTPAVPEADSDLIVVQADFSITYRFVRGDPYTTA